MDSDLHRNHQQQQIMNSGLTRYRSAPSSYLSNLIGSGLSGDEDSDQFFNNRVPSPETERILSRFMASFAGVNGDNSSSHQNLGQIGVNEPQIINSVKKEQEGIYSEPQQQQQMIYLNQSQSQSQQDHNLAVSRSSMDQPLMAAANPPANLLRQSSSPAGFFAQLNMDNAYPMIRSMDDFGADSVPDSSFSSGKRLKGETSFSSGSPLSSGLLARIPENEAKIMAFNRTHNDGSLGETRRKDGDYVARYPSSSWDDSVMLSDSFLKDLGESDESMFSNLNSSENQNNEGRIRAPTTLTHHLSLPTSTSESMEKLLQFQDYVPLKSSRAKRGCATHPRSIAERVRRTKISERMRKLQELVPNMDKQTNTADMLDLAVDYIKELQIQAKALSDSHAKCTCPHKQKI